MADSDIVRVLVYDDTGSATIGFYDGTENLFGSGILTYNASEGKWIGTGLSIPTNSDVLITIDTSVSPAPGTTFIASISSTGDIITDDPTYTELTNTIINTSDDPISVNTVPPVFPGGFTVTAVPGSTSQYNIMWTAASNTNVVRGVPQFTYYIYYSTSAGTLSTNSSYFSVTGQTNLQVTTLDDGTYYFAVIAADGSGNTSSFTNGYASAVEVIKINIEIANDLENAISGPIPASPDDGGVIRTANIVPNTTLIIFTVSGRVVKELTNENNTYIDWDFTNEDGEIVPSGVYYGHLSSSAGEKVVKFVVVR
jgi:flagellar hook assembly protein FlgD